MDLHLLVDRIATALGPAATPERVEAVAAAVLDASQTAPTASPLPSASRTGERVILSAFGHDQPGILAALTTDLHEAGVNILDVSQKILHGYFTLILVADLDTGRTSMAQLKERLTATGQRLDVKVLLQHEDLFDAMHRP